MPAQNCGDRMARARQAINRDLDAITCEIGCGVGSGFGAVTALAFLRVDQCKADVFRAGQDTNRFAQGA